MGRSYFHLHLVSDSTGETLITVARAAAAQYEGVSAIEHVYPLVRSPAQLERVISEIEAEGVWEDPIVTEVVPFDVFYKAEGYHQGYFRNNAVQPYCQVVIAPKVAKFRKQHLDKLRA